MPSRRSNAVSPAKLQGVIRRNALQARRSMTAEEREIASLLICEQLTATPWFRRAQTVGCYLAADDEVSVWSLISSAMRRKKRVFVPTIAKHRRMAFVEFASNTQLHRNRFGLQEPVEGREARATNLDLVIAPIAAFDNQGNRIGMGGGYYDRTFSFLRSRSTQFRPRLIGAAFSCQQTAAITPNPWDVTLLEVFTENGPVLSRHN